jgi:PAS domain S-box-containing protein
MYHILYVDDEPDLLEIGKLFLEQSGQISVDIITSAPAALSRMQSENFDAVVSDYQMPEMDGIAFLKIIRASYPELPFILFTGRGREEIVIEAINNGVDSYLQKGGSPTAQFAELLHRIMIAIERRQAVRALRDSEKKYRSLLESLRDSIIVHRNTRILYLNPAGEKVLGYSQESLLGQSIMILVPPEFHEIVTTAVKKRMAGESFEPYELDLIRGDGNRISVIMSGNLVEFEGAPASVNLITDITERKRAENALRDSEKKYRSVIESIQDIYYRTDKDGNLLIASPSGATLLRYNSVNDILGKQIATFYLDPAERTELLARLQKTGSVSNFETRLKKKDGTVVFVSTNSHYYLDESGAIAGVEGIIRDITEQKRAEEALRKSERQLNAMATNIPGVVYRFYMNPDGVYGFDYISERSRQILGVENDPVTFLDRMFKGIVPDERERILSTFRHSASMKKRWEFSCWYVKPSGEKIWISTVSHPVKENDRLIFDGVIFDNTHWKMAEEKLIGKNEELDASYGQIAAADEELRGQYDELAKGERLLRESEEKYRLVVENSHDAIYIYRNDQILFANSEASALTGYAHDELMKIRIWDLVHPNDREQLIESARKRFAGKEISSELTARLLTKDGISLSCEFFVDLITYQGAPAILGIARDITERKNAEEALRESERRFRELSDLLPLVVYEVDTAGNLTYANQIAFERFGYTTDDFRQGLNVMQMLAPDELERAAAAFRAMGEGKGRNLGSAEEYMALRKDGSTFPVSIYLSPIVVKGRITGFRGVIVDITERKKAEVTLRESEEKFRSIVETSSDIIWEIDLQGKLRYISPTITTIMGYTPEEVIGRSMIDLVLEERKSFVIKELAKYTSSEGPFSPIEVPARHRNGNEILIEIRPARLTGKDGILNGFRGVAVDITERKKAQEALYRANRQLSLLSGVTRHDILNKVTVVLGYLKIAEMKFGDPTQAEYLKKMESAITAIKSQIEFTRIYQDLGTQEPQWIDLDAVMPLSQVPVTIALNPEVKGVSVFADPMLERVFFNLLDNSIHHGERVTGIRVSFHQSGPDLVVVWEDNGIGIAADEKERIFEQGFGRNTGLGMFLIREILSLTGITISETGEPVKGARFEILVPAGSFRI